MKRAAHHIVLASMAISFLLLVTRTTSAQAPTGANANTPAAIVQRLLGVYGGRWTTGDVGDWIAEGQITYFNTAGPGSTFDVTVIRKGKSQVQRIVKQSGNEVRVGTDGKRAWDSLNGWFVANAQGQASFFIETQTVRSIQALLDYQARGLTVRAGAKNGNNQLLELEDRDGRKTTYTVDDGTGTVSKLEFITGQAKDPFGNMASSMEAHVFSDYRQIQGLLTPFKAERFINGIKAEEMRFSSVRYNASVTDDAFQP